MKRISIVATGAFAVLTTLSASAGRQDCWMTGGGSVFNPYGIPVTTATLDAEGRVTHGFELHCDGRPNNLEVNFHAEGTKFKLTNLLSAICLDSATIEPDPPGANFDTYIGSGVGRYGAGNGAPGYCADWIFTDAGEPGTADTMSLTVHDCDGNTIISIAGVLSRGNHQAHSQ
jgi:hypothetical protein